MTKTSARVAITKLAIIILLSAALVAVIGSGRGKVAHEVRPDLSDEIDKLSTGSDLVAGASSVKQVMVPIMESAAEDQVQVTVAINGEPYKLSFRSSTDTEEAAIELCNSVREKYQLSAQNFRSACVVPISQHIELERRKLLGQDKPEEKHSTKLDAKTDVENSKREAERVATEQARVEAERVATEQARVEAERVATEQARVEADRLAAEQARVEAGRESAEQAATDSSFQDERSRRQLDAAAVKAKRVSETVKRAEAARESKAEAERFAREKLKFQEQMRKNAAEANARNEADSNTLNPPHI